MKHFMYHLTEKVMLLRCSLGARLLRIEDRVLLLSSLKEHAEFAYKQVLKLTFVMLGHGLLCDY